MHNDIYGSAFYHMSMVKDKEEYFTIKIENISIIIFISQSKIQIEPNSQITQEHFDSLKC